MGERSRSWAASSLRTVGSMLESDLSPKVAAAIAPALLLVTGALVAGLVDIWRGPAPRYLPRVVWTAVALASFPWGLLVYLYVGRGASAPSETPATIPGPLPAMT